MNVLQNNESNLWFTVMRNGDDSILVRPGCVFIYNGMSNDKWSGGWNLTPNIKNSNPPDEIDNKGQHVFLDTTPVSLSSGENKIYLKMGRLLKESEYYLTIVNDAGSLVEIYDNDWIKMHLQEFYADPSSISYESFSDYQISTDETLYKLIAEVTVQDKIVDIKQIRTGIICVSRFIRITNGV